MNCYDCDSGEEIYTSKDLAVIRCKKDNDLKTYPENPINCPKEDKYENN